MEEHLVSEGKLVIFLPLFLVIGPSHCTGKFLSLKIEKVDRDSNRYLLPLFGVVRGVVGQSFSFSESFEIFLVALIVVIWRDIWNAQVF